LIIKSHQLQTQGERIAQNADVIVFPDKAVANAFTQLFSVSDSKIKIRPQGLIKNNLYKNNKAYARCGLRKKLDIAPSAQIVLGMGHGDYRKGVDLFVEMGQKILLNHPHVYFVWVGDFEKTMEGRVEALLSQNGKREHFYFCGFENQPDLYFAGADVFALTSREDPYPSVVLQSLDVSVPVVGFQDAGGFNSLIEQGCGLLVPKDDVSAFAKSIVMLLNDTEKNAQFGARGQQLMEDHFAFSHYLFDLLDWLQCPQKRISVIVPNYNYAKYLKERLSSVLNQSYPIYELIILDDASTDNSVEVINACLSATNKSIDYKIIVNSENSGSVCAQWKKGIDIARGDFVWIAEADDVAYPDFLREVIRSFDDNEVVMSYSQSQQMNDEGKIIADNYHDYTNDIDPEKWCKDYLIDGKDEIGSALSIKNTIPNVSSVLFRRENLEASINRCQSKLKQLKIAGDWLIYTDILQTGKIAYHAQSLNMHRRHQKSVTHSSSLDIEHVAEVIFMQRHVAEVAQLTLPVLQSANEYIQKLCKHFAIEEAEALEKLQMKVS
jgi:hypothetical protein